MGSGGFAFDPQIAAAMRVRFDAIIAQPPFTIEGGAAEAVAALGGRVVADVMPNAAPATIARFAGKAVVIIDVAETDDVSAHDLVLASNIACAGRNWALLVACTHAQIDMVCAAIDGAPGGRSGRVQMLCEAATSDWVAALAVAIDDAPVLGERVRENEAARLARLNEEVARIAEVLARLSRREADPAAKAAEHRPQYAEAPPPSGVTAGEVRDVIRARRLRERFFSARLLEDPAWDMMLDLFAAHLERAQVSVSSLCIAAAVAPTTALRWIGKLTEVGLLMREADPFDRRRAFMALTPAAREGMERYMAALHEAGLRLA